MKKYLLTVCVMLGIVSSIVASGFMRNFGKVSWLKGGDVVTLIYEDDLPTKVQVTLLDAYNDPVFSEVIEMPSGFRRPYNLAELPDGEYVFEVVDRDKEYHERIDLRTTRQPLAVHVSTLKSEEEKYLLSVPNVSQEVITVSIYDDEANLCFQEKEKVKKGFAKIYKLKKEPAAANKKNRALVFMVSDNHGDYVAVQKIRRQ